MIKFNCLIHKETGTVIKYEDWKERFEKGHNIKCSPKDRMNLWSYPPKDVLFSDDFEIIYDSEFTGEELWLIHCRCGEDENLQDKVRDILKNRDGLQTKYGIEV